MEEEEKLKQAGLCPNDKIAAHVLSQEAFNSYIKPKFADIDDDRLQIIFREMFNLCMNGISFGRKMPLDESMGIVVTKANVEKRMTRKDLRNEYGEAICDLCVINGHHQYTPSGMCEEQWCEEAEDEFAAEKGITLLD